MATKPTGASALKHAPIGRESFFGIRLTRDPEESYAAVCRILAEHRARPDVALERCSPHVDGFGVESLALADDSELLYVNVGDTAPADVEYDNVDAETVNPTRAVPDTVNDPVEVTE